jgi:hypothetical protein
MTQTPMTTATTMKAPSSADLARHGTANRRYAASTGGLPNGVGGL